MNVVLDVRKILLQLGIRQQAYTEYLSCCRDPQHSGMSKVNGILDPDAKKVNQIQWPHCS